MKMTLTHEELLKLPAKELVKYWLNLEAEKNDRKIEEKHFEELKD